MIYTDYETMIYGDDPSNSPLAFVLERALSTAEEFESSLQITIRCDSDAVVPILYLPISFMVDRTLNSDQIIQKIYNCIDQNIGYNFVGQIKIEFASDLDDIVYASFIRQVDMSPQTTNRRNTMAVLKQNTDYSKFIFTDPFERVVERVSREAQLDNKKLKVEIRCKHIDMRSGRQEHVFVVPPTESLLNPTLVMKAVHERLIQTPGPDFEGQVRINFYQDGNMGCKYGSFTRELKSDVTDEEPSISFDSLLWNPDSETWQDFDFSDFFEQESNTDELEELEELKEKNQKLEQQVDELIKTVAILTRKALL
jgi:hypothetical protein